MAEVRKVLGQSAPEAATLTDAYTVPGATQAVVSTITLCNLTGIDDLVSISVAVAGAADESKQYVVSDCDLEAHETKTLTLGLTLGATDVVRVYSSAGLTSFNLFGVELT